MKNLLVLSVCMVLISQFISAQGFKKESSLGKHAFGLGLEVGLNWDDYTWYNKSILGYGISGNYDYKFNKRLTGTVQIGYKKFSNTVDDYYETSTSNLSILFGVKISLVQNIYSILQIGYNNKKTSKKYSLWNNEEWTTNKDEAVACVGFGYTHKLTDKFEIDATLKWIGAIPYVRKFEDLNNSANLRVAVAYIL